MSRDLIDTAVGALLGTMVGDALGMPGSGKERQEIQSELGRIDSLREGLLPSGEYTDETEMTLNLCTALLAEEGFDQRAVAKHLAETFTPWRNYSPHVYGIMARIRQGLSWDPPGVTSWGAGAAARVAPLGVLYAGRAEVSEHAAAQAEITHNHPNGVAGSVAQAVAVAAAAEQGLFETSLDVPALMDPVLEPTGEHSVALRDAIARITDIPSETEPKNLPAILAAAYPCDGTAVGTVPAAMAAVLLTSSFEDAVIVAVNCGRVTDTLGALAGGLAGAFYGATGIPERLTAGLANGERGRDYAIGLGEALGALVRAQNGPALELDDDLDD